MAKRKNEDVAALHKRIAHLEEALACIVDNIEDKILYDYARYMLGQEALDRLCLGRHSAKTVIYHIKGCKKSCEGNWVCKGCHRCVGYCNGNGDDDIDLCNQCWMKKHYPGDASVTRRVVKP